MALAEGQLQVRDLVIGPGTPYELLADFNPWTRSARADQTGKRAWNDGSWSGAEWVDDAVVPLPVFIQTASPGDWMAAYQALVAAFAPSSQDVELRFVFAGTQYLMRGRPRTVEPESRLVGRGVSFVKCAFVALDPTIYSGDEHSVGLGLPSTTGGLSIPASDGASAGGVNPGFESGTTGWVVDAGTLTQSTDHVKAGTYSGKLAADGTNNPRATYDQSATPVTPGKSYRISGRLYAPVALPSTAAVTIQWYDSGGTFLDQDVVTATLTPGVWTNLRRVVKAPAGAAFAGRQFSMNDAPAAGTLLYGDDIQVYTRTTGLTVPFTVPAAVTAGKAQLSNVGTKPVGLVLRVDGPVSEPRISLLAGDGTVTTLRLFLTLAAGEWLDIDTAARTVYLNGTASRRGQATGGWPILPKGGGEISFGADTYDPDARLTVTWRDAWY